MIYQTSLAATDAFWALIALFIFLFILYIFNIPHLLLTKLDERSKNIADELEEARALKEEAQQNLVLCQKKCKDAEEEAKALLERAQREARQIENDARSLSDKYLEQQRKLLEEKLKTSAIEALKSVKDRTVDVLINSSKDIISQELDVTTNNKLVKASIDTIKAKLQN